MDFKYLLDSDKNQHHALSGVCGGTVYQVACLVKNRGPKHVVHCFTEMWLTHSGVPENVVVDQGSDFESTCAQESEDFSESSSASLGAMRDGSKAWSKATVGQWMNCEAFHIIGRELAMMALAMCMHADNATQTRCGVAPEQTVCGPPFRWCSLNEWGGFMCTSRFGK